MLAVKRRLGRGTGRWCVQQGDYVAIFQAIHRASIANAEAIILEAVQTASTACPLLLLQWQLQAVSINTTDPVQVQATGADSVSPP